MCGSCSGTLKAGTCTGMMLYEDHCRCCSPLLVASESEMALPFVLLLARSALIANSVGGLVKPNAGSWGVPYPCCTGTGIKIIAIVLKVTVGVRPELGWHKLRSIKVHAGLIQHCQI